MAKAGLQIDLLGTSFAIQADEKPEYLAKLYEHLKKSIRQIEAASSVKDPIKISLIASLMLCDELFKEKAKHSNESYIDLATAEKITLEMISKIDRAIQ